MAKKLRAAFGNGLWMAWSMSSLPAPPASPASKLAVSSCADSAGHSICFLLGLGWGLLSRQPALSYLSDGLSKLWQLKGKEEGNWKSKKELKGAQTWDRGELEKQWSQICPLQHLQQCCEHSGSQAMARMAYFNFSWVCGLTGLAWQCSLGVHAATWSLG